jgi:hypothetical protein
MKMGKKLILINKAIHGLLSFITQCVQGHGYFTLRFLRLSHSQLPLAAASRSLSLSLFLSLDRASTHSQRLVSTQPSVLVVDLSAKILKFCAFSTMTTKVYIV